MTNSYHLLIWAWWIGWNCTFADILPFPFPFCCLSLRRHHRWSQWNRGAIHNGIKRIGPNIGILPHNTPKARTAIGLVSSYWSNWRMANWCQTWRTYNVQSQKMGTLSFQDQLWVSSCKYELFMTSHRFWMNYLPIYVFSTKKSFKNLSLTLSNFR